MEQDFRSWLVGQMRVRNLNQSQVARMINVAPSLVSRYLNHGVLPRADVVDRIARVIAISDGLAAALVMARDRDQFGPDWHDGRLVFRNTFDGLLNRTQVRLALAAICERAGVPVISPHGLRHAGASMAIRAGMDAKLVSERLGHRSVGFTLDRYVHVNAGDHEDAAKLVAGLLGVG